MRNNLQVKDDLTLVTQLETSTWSATQLLCCTAQQPNQLCHPVIIIGKIRDVFLYFCVFYLYFASSWVVTRTMLAALDLTVSNFPSLSWT